MKKSSKPKAPKTVATLVDEHLRSSMPTHRPSRAVVEAVAPVVDGGKFPAKAALGRPLRLVADVFTDGHDVVRAAVTINSPSATAGRSDATEDVIAMRSIFNDRFETTIVPDALGRWTYEVTGWVSHAETWRQGIAAKIDAGLDVGVETSIGVSLLDSMIRQPTPTATDADLDDIRRFRTELTDGDLSSIDDASWPDVFFRAEQREPTDSFPVPLEVDVDPALASIGSWYSFFPRSTASGTSGVGRSNGEVGPPSTLLGAVDRLDHIADMGFDVVYIPPVHPIGNTNRKGKNNSTIATPDDVGSPYAIGSADGGHFAVAPELGTVADVSRFAEACTERGMHLALDIAFNCSPDHPWVTEHPEWFTTRPDGSIQFAENPPKKYEDIYPLDFETSDWQALWQELADVFRFWIDKGVKIFRVDNPHTKAFAFWEWAISTIRTDRPDVIFLSEAFTRPRPMQRLAKLGFNQSYTYFAWRNTAHELREYFEELSSETLHFLRPNAWPNTHDILTEHLQRGGRPAFISRAILAATLSPSWGVYGPQYELMEAEPRPGVEDYNNSEKYEIRHWDLDRPDSLAPLLKRLNQIRREHPSLTDLASVRFHPTDNDRILCFTKIDPAGVGLPTLVIVNVDPHSVARGFVDLDLAAIGLEYGSDYLLVDELGGATYQWTANRNFVELRPDGVVGHIFTVQRRDDENADLPHTQPESDQ